MQDGVGQALKFFSPMSCTSGYLYKKSLDFVQIFTLNSQFP